jgi:hypothetical protein
MGKEQRAQAIIRVVLEVTLRRAQDVVLARGEQRKDGRVGTLDDHTYPAALGLSHLWQSVAINGNQWQSVVLSGS